VSAAWSIFALRDQWRAESDTLRSYNIHFGLHNLVKPEVAWEIDAKSCVVLSSYRTNRRNFLCNFAKPVWLRKAPEPEKWVMGTTTIASARELGLFVEVQCRRSLLSFVLSVLVKFMATKYVCIWAWVTVPYEWYAGVASPCLQPSINRSCSHYLLSLWFALTDTISTIG